jgi:hypothetical protein
LPDYAAHPGFFLLLIFVIFVGMKKLAAIIFSIFYLTVTIGIAVNVHYCHGEIYSVQFFAMQDDCCCGDSGSSNNCCHLDSQLIKLADQQAFTAHLRLNPEQPVSILFLDDEQGDGLVCESGFSFFITGPDILPPKPPAWLLHCSLIFYG